MTVTRSESNETLDSAARFRVCEFGAAGELSPKYDKQNRANVAVRLIGPPLPLDQNFWLE